MDKNFNILDDYKSCLPRWDKFSSIRQRPRRLLKTIENDDGYYYPIERQPLVIHPLIQKCGKELVSQLLIHSGYKFMADIAFVEVELINNTALNVYNGNINYGFPESLKRDMLTIIVDEAYHAYVALDYINQMESVTGEKMFYKTETVALDYCIRKYIKLLPVDMRPTFELIAICIGENTLTKELFSMTKQPNLNPFFHQVMADHMIDEGRHSSIFRLVLRQTWARMPEEFRLRIGDILPKFLLEYTGDTLQNKFNCDLLRHFGFCQTDIETIIRETGSTSRDECIIKTNPVTHQMIDLMKIVGITEHRPTHEKFIQASLLEMAN